MIRVKRDWVRKKGAVQKDFLYIVLIVYLVWDLDFVSPSFLFLFFFFCEKWISIPFPGREKKNRCFSTSLHNTFIFYDFSTLYFLTSFSSLLFSSRLVSFIQIIISLHRLETLSLPPPFPQKPFMIYFRPELDFFF